MRGVVAVGQAIQAAQVVLVVAVLVG